LGYFENEEEHPYREWLIDLPNRYDKERTILGYPPIRSATEKVQQFVIELYYPENWTVKKALGKIRYEKVLVEEV